MTPDATLKEVIVEISAKRLGATAVVDSEGKVVGVITDGDLRRMLEKNGLRENVRAKDIMTVNPRTIAAEELAVEALDLMRKSDISQLLVTGTNKYLGIIHLHDLIREGLI